MTYDEIKKYYNIPEEIIKMYESWESVKKKREKGEDTPELEKLKLIILLKDSGFKDEEIKNYIEGLTEDRDKILILDKKRKNTLDKIHIYEKQLENLDYLRYEIRRKNNNKI